MELNGSARLSFQRGRDAAARKSEIALRTALGSSRGRVIRQFLIKGVLIAATGGLLGLLLVFWGMDLLVALIPASPHSYLPNEQRA